MRWLRNPYMILPYMLLGAAVPLLFALYVQYVQQIPPCDLCMVQRYPYAMVLALLLFTLPGLTYPQWLQFQGLLAALAWLTTSAVGFYHYAIEQGWIAYQGECVSAAVTSTSMEDLKAQIASAPLVSCAEVGWEFLGISMPFWNGVTGLVLALGMVYMLRVQRRAS